MGPDRSALANSVTSSSYLTSLNLYGKTVKSTGFRKMWYIYTIEYYSAIKKNEIMPFAATLMDIEIVILSEVSQTEKDEYRMILLICGILKKIIEMNLFTIQKQTHRLRE